MRHADNAVKSFDGHNYVFYRLASLYFSSLRLKKLLFAVEAISRQREKMKNITPDLSKRMQISCNELRAVKLPTNR